MNYDYVMVDIWIPAANIRNDMLIPYQMPIKQVIELLEAIMPELGIAIFKIQEETKLYQFDTLEEMNTNNSFMDYQIENGETLLLL